MPTKTWKKNELSWVKIGARRNHFEKEDCRHFRYSIECKHRSPQNYPKLLRNWYEQARANAGIGKTPLLSIHLAGEIRQNDLVVLRRSDFEALYFEAYPQDATPATPDQPGSIKYPIGDE
jgi:hypothetical protein